MDRTGRSALVRDGAHVDPGLMLDRMRVSGVIHGSPADAAGFHRHIGKRILRVNGVPVATLRELASVASASAHIDFEFYPDTAGTGQAPAACRRATNRDMGRVVNNSHDHPMYIGGAVSQAAAAGDGQGALPTHAQAIRRRGAVEAHPMAQRPAPVEAPGQPGMFRSGYKFPQNSPQGSPRRAPIVPEAVSLTDMSRLGRTSPPGRVSPRLRPSARQQLQLLHLSPRGRGEGALEKELDALAADSNSETESLPHAMASHAASPSRSPAKPATASYVMGQNLRKLQECSSHSLRPQKQSPQRDAGPPPPPPNRLLSMPAGIRHHIFEDDVECPTTDDSASEPRSPHRVAAVAGAGQDDDAAYHSAVAAVAQLAQRQSRTETLLLSALTSLQARLPKGGCESASSPSSSSSGSSDAAAPRQRCVDVDRHGRLNLVH
eukprot:TRINITY_DN3913_c0_g1_i1.p1 TRINITY_DN3913_c0_g1~~TRINITY_DN3913_c0_g1_i1.p1  ORF type:complete len:434 (+),score=113.63 TRINITY_DN3913_c0_g1_i1:75-1376(+)